MAEKSGAEENGQTSMDIPAFSPTQKELIRIIAEKKIGVEQLGKALYSNDSGVIDKTEAARRSLLRIGPKLLELGVAITYVDDDRPETKCPSFTPKQLQLIHAISKKETGIEELAKQLYSGGGVEDKEDAVRKVLDRVEPKLAQVGITVTCTRDGNAPRYYINAESAKSLEQMLASRQTKRSNLFYIDSKYAPIISKILSSKPSETAKSGLEGVIGEDVQKFNDAQKRVFLEKLRTPYVRLSEPYEPPEFQNQKKVRFGVVSDTHMNSQYSDWGILDAIYERFEKESVQAVFHCGDITDGEGVYPGQWDDLRCFGWEETVALVKKEYPKIKDVKTYFITGKHDAYYLRKFNGAVDIGRKIASAREDLVYISMQGGGGKLWVGDIKIGTNTLLKLVHPNMAAPYAISYPPQKMVESIEGGKKPQILVLGGFHKFDWIRHRDIEVIQAGTTQHQTPYMLSRKWFGSLTGLIVEAELTDEGPLKTRPTVSEIPFYD